MRQALAVFGISTVLSGSALLVQAQSVPSFSVQASAADLLNQGQAKAKRGDYQGAIAAYTQALQVSESSIKSLDDSITRHQLFLQETQALKQLETDLADATAGDL
jgi:tetratricopeptide (TPR) repeat protein